MKVYLKQLHLAEQGLYKLEEEEKVLNTKVVESLVALVYLLLLSDFFNPAFPELFFYDTPEPSSLYF